MMISDLEHLVVVSETRNSEEFSEIKGGAFPIWAPSPFNVSNVDQDGKPLWKISAVIKASASAFGRDVFTNFNSFSYLWTF